MWNTRKRRSGSRLGHDGRGHTCIQHCLASLKFEKPTTKLLNAAFWVYRIKKAFVNTPTRGSKMKTEKLISGSLRGNFWQPLISKIFEKIVYDQLYNYLNVIDLLTSCHSLAFVLFTVRSLPCLRQAATDVSIRFDKGLLNGVIFIDLKKAFDTSVRSRNHLTKTC